MKTKYTVMASAMLMVTAFSVSAQPGPPAQYINGPLPKGFAPDLFNSEKAAFAAYEGVLQEAEGLIYTSGCSGAAGTWDVAASVEQNGTGSVALSVGGSPQLQLNVAQGPAMFPTALGGTRFFVNGNPSNKLKNLTMSPFNSATYYGKGGWMMVETALFSTRNVNGLLDFLSGRVIKDFYKSYSPIWGVPVIHDWGLQSVEKNYVPEDKWWQRSHAHRSDNIDGRTVFVKDRLYSRKALGSAGKCKITLDTAGLNDADGFDQTGTLKIEAGKVPGPFPLP